MSAVLRELRAQPAAPSHPANNFPCCLQRWHDLFKVKGTNLALSTFKHLCLAPRWGRKWVRVCPPGADLAWWVSSALPSCEIWANCCLSFWKNVGNNSLLRSLLQENDLIHNQQMLISLSLVPCGNACHETAWLCQSQACPAAQLLLMPITYILVLF